MAMDAVITGASTGIGRAAVKVITSNGWRVFAAVRKEADAASLRSEFGDKVHPLIFDVTDAAAVAAAAAEVRALLGGRTLKGLVNNAGMGLGGPLALQPVAEIRRVFEVNVLGPVAVSQAFIPLLGGDRSLSGAPGRIVNITSTGGVVAPPFIGDYAMSKHALEAFTDCLRRELMLYGIDVIAIGPGAVATPIWDKAEGGDQSRYASSDFGPALAKFVQYFVTGGRNGLPPERIGEAIHLALTTPKPRARYAVLRGKFLNWTVPRLLPKRVLDRRIGRGLGLTPPV